MPRRGLLVMVLCINFPFSMIFSMGNLGAWNQPIPMGNIQSAMLTNYIVVESLGENDQAPKEDPTVEEAVYDEVDSPKVPEENIKKITISVAGDCTLGWDETSSYVNSLPYVFEKQGNNFGYFFEKVKPVFEQDDLTLVNLETTLTTEKNKAQKKFRFKGDPSYINILKEGSVEMVNISNNHIYDYLQGGFNETIKTLDEGGIAYSGEGVIGYHRIGDIMIASIGYGGWSTSIKDQLAMDIQVATEKADITLVSFHWGEESKNYPNKTQVSLGHFAIDQGADMVIGHHPHVIQGIEKYNGKYIVYSLGNFVFGGNRNPRDKDTFIFQGNFFMEDNLVTKVEGEILPCRISSVENINNYQPILFEGEERRRVLDRIIEYSKNLEYGITQEETIKPTP